MNNEMMTLTHYAEYLKGYDMEMQFVRRDEPSTTTSPEIALALEHHRKMNDSGQGYAYLEIMQFEHHRVVTLHIGHYVMGRKERITLTHNYYLDIDGKATYFNQAHT